MMLSPPFITQCPLTGRRHRPRHSDDAEWCRYTVVLPLTPGLGQLGTVYSAEKGLLIVKGRCLFTGT